jgi:type III secretion system YscI/HrpB-like protein
MILDGLQKLRGTFDVKEARLNEVMNSSVVDSRTLLTMQAEVVGYTLLVDVTSKLTGKTTQAFDTLMKGQ